MIMKLKKIKMLCIFFMGAFTVHSAQALGLVEAYSLALRNDPGFQAAIKENEASQEIKNIARAALLPQVSASYQTSPHNRQKREYTSTNFYGEEHNVIEHEKYKSYSGSLTLTQPIFDYEAWSRYQMGIAQTLMSNAKYHSSLLDLAVRVTNAYLDLTNARDQLDLAYTQTRSYEQQLKQNRVMMQGGEGTLTDISETEAAYNLAKARQIEAHDTMESSERLLGSLIGISLSKVNGVQSLHQHRFTLIDMTPSTYEEWEKIAIKNNPVIAEKQRGMDVAKYDIERNRSGFLPVVNLYATHSVNDSSTSNTIGQRYNTDSVGLQVSLPIFSGGETLAATRQAKARYEQAMYERDAQILNILNDLHTQFSLVKSSKEKISAYEYAVKNAEVRITSTEKSVLAGQRVNLDVINATQQLYQARSELTNAKYTYIKAYVNLLNNSGTLEYKDIIHISRYFTPVNNSITH